ncbi:MAG: slipin family protein [Synechococcales cyanobacterium T60_A2020_003]|nr:slipin family protein [Synechococcales cyanobacterium T60_A2020_003]
MGTVLGVAMAMLLLTGLSGLKVDREYQRGVIFRLGRYKGTMGPGIYWIIPGVDQKVQVDIRTKTVDITPQEAVTADSVTIRVNAVLYYRILDANRAINKVENYEMAVYQTAMTTLRNVVGQAILDEILQNRDAINDKVQTIVDELTEPWGVVIEHVEMKDVEIPLGMQRAMAKEAEATREKRARLIKAAAEYEASKMLTQAARNIAENPAALELRRLQMLTEIGIENNTTTLVMLPSDFMLVAKQATEFLAKGSGVNGQPSGAIAPAEPATQSPIPFEPELVRQPDEPLLDALD